jgi:hypothetical protein
MYPPFHQIATPAAGDKTTLFGAVATLAAR